MNFIKKTIIAALCMIMITTMTACGSGAGATGSGAGATTTACNTCNGSGKITCGICGGTGQQLQTSQYYDALMGWQTNTYYDVCSGCAGAGYFTCTTCGGTGTITADSSSNSQVSNTTEAVKNKTEIWANEARLCEQGKTEDISSVISQGYTVRSDNDAIVAIDGNSMKYNGIGCVTIYAENDKEVNKSYCIVVSTDTAKNWDATSPVSRELLPIDGRSSFTSWPDATFSADNENIVSIEVKPSGALITGVGFGGTFVTSYAPLPTVTTTKYYIIYPAHK